MLKAAADLIGHFGVRSTTLDQIGVHAGYSRGLPVKRYGTKAALVVALIKSMDMWLDRVFDEATDGLHGLPAFHAFLQTYVEKVANNADGSAALAALRLEASHGMTELVEPLQAMAHRWRSRLAGHLRDAQSQGAIRNIMSPEVQADIALAIADKMLMVARMEGDLSPRLAPGLLHTLDQLFGQDHGSTDQLP